MRKILTLTKEQARTLYNLLSNYSVGSRSDNRKRFNFLEVIEKDVFNFDDEIESVSKNEKDLKKVNEAVTELGKQTKKFVFKDRDVFAKVKDMFEKVFEVGTVNRDKMGKIEKSPLVGRNAKIYMELEDAFADVKDIKEKKEK